MAKKTYDKMSEDELAQARIELDEQMQALRAEKAKIQAVITARREAENKLRAQFYTEAEKKLQSYVAGAGNIESAEHFDKTSGGK